MIAKFRVWDKPTKKMIYPEEIWLKGDTWNVVERINGMGFSISDNLNGYLMQSTGLHDKNGREIYEGDCLKINLPMGGFWGNVKVQKTGQVIYEPDYAGYIVQWEYTKNQHHERLGCDLAFDSEIIGNIYETPELVKSENEKTI